MEEKLGRITDRCRIAAIMNLQESTGFGISGEVLIQIYNAETGERVYRHHAKNLVVNTAGILLAEFGKNTGVPGITHLAFGTGDIGWDPLDPPSPDSSVTSLETEIFRKLVGSSQYVDGNGDPSVPATNRIDLNFGLTTSEGNGALNEMGLFGGTGASTPGGGRMINVFRMPTISKSSAFSLQISWRLTFG
jgi:hypothetical protein